MDIYRTCGSETTRSMSDPGRMSPVAKEPNGRTCAARDRLSFKGALQLLSNRHM